MNLPTFTSRFIRAEYHRPSTWSHRGERYRNPAQLQLRVGSHPIDYPLWKAEGRLTTANVALVEALGRYMESRFTEQELARPNRALFREAREQFLSTYAPKEG